MHSSWPSGLCRLPAIDLGGLLLRRVDRYADALVPPELHARFPQYQAHQPLRLPRWPCEAMSQVSLDGSFALFSYLHPFMISLHDAHKTLTARLVLHLRTCGRCHHSGSGCQNQTESRPVQASHSQATVARSSGTSRSSHPAGHRISASVSLPNGVESSCE